MWEDGTLEEMPYVTINGEKYYVTMPKYKGSTPLTAARLNLMFSKLKQLVGVQTTVISDLNKATTHGFYMVGPAAANVPTGVNPAASQQDGRICYVFVLALDAVEPIIQFFIDSKNHTIYMRKTKGWHNGFENNWYKIAEGVEQE